MAIQKIPFNAKPYSKNDYPDKYTTDNAYNDELINGIYFDDGSLRKRPGYSLFFDLGQTDKKIDGMYFSRRLGVLLVICNTNLYSVNSTGTATLIGSGIFVRGTKAYFEDQGTYIFAVNGGSIVYTDGTTASIITDSNAPSNPTHLAFIDGYVLFNVPSSTRFKFTDSIDPTIFPGLNFADAEGKPDYIQAIFSKNRELFIFGTETIEVWYDDGDTPFSRRNDIFLEFGVLAKHSIVLIRNTAFMFLDNSGNIVILEGFTPRVISDPIKHILKNLSTVSLSGAIATEINIGSVRFYKIEFPDDGRSFLYDYQKDMWYEWAYRNTGTIDYSVFRGGIFTGIDSWGFDLIADSKDSKVYKIGFNYLTDNGNNIRVLRRTQVIDHGTRSLKRSSSVLMKFRRGNGYTDSVFNALDTDAEPYVMIRWRDNNNVNYGNWHNFSLGKDGKEYTTVTIKPMGMYYTRQYEIACTDPVSFILYDMEEDVEVLK